MRSSPKHKSSHLLLLACLAAYGADAYSDDLGTARFMSFATRDMPPSASEAQAVQAGSKSVSSLTSEWLASPEHLLRVHRHFRDMFGVASNVTILNSKFVLADQGGGVLALTGIPAKASCDPATAVQASAWWLDAGQTVSMCPSAVSASITPSAGLNCANTGNNGILNSACGCGPNQILCVPLTVSGPLEAEVREEFALRGAYAYQQNLSWSELIAGNFLYGTRLLYWYYLTTQTTFSNGSMPSASELEQLQSLSMTSPSQVAFPAGPARAGVVTAPGFLINNDSYRARVRIMTQSLLCKDVDPTLNVDGIATYLNPSFTAADKSHGAQANCNGCHYPMDNMGSLNFGWSAQGIWQTPAPSQIGHAFGQNGSGPAFLGNSYVQLASGFNSCMAQKAWEGFSGLPWTDLSATDQQTFTTAASSPRTLILTVLNSPTLQNSRQQQPSAAAASPAPASAASEATFTSQIAPILNASCAGSSCHSTGSPFVGFVGDAATFQSLSAQVITRIQSGGSDKMPPAGASVTPLSSANITTLLNYLQSN